METPIPQITCLLKTLEGDKEIYKIAGDSIYYFDKKDKLAAERFSKLESIPDTVLGNDRDFGCGVCTDGVDYKFVFNSKGEETTWTIEPGSTIQPKEVSDYFKVLISLYSEIIKN